MTSMVCRGRSALVAWLLVMTACGGTESGVHGFDIGFDLLPGFDVVDTTADLPPADADLVDKDLATDPGPDADVIGVDLPPDVAPDADAAPDADVTDVGPDAPDAICDPLAGDLCPCLEGCPQGWACVEVPDSCPDCVFVCADLFATLCRPCAANADCVTWQGPEAACLDLGPAEGRFCGGACGTDDACPAGYHCADATTAEGDAARQCLPDDGACACSAFAIEHALSTACSVTTGAGTCFGVRTCTAAGLTDCDAATPTDEACDGLDNDCDGSTDEVASIPTTCGVGACAATGVLACVDGAPTDSCAPGAPAAHDATCDAIDDDCDGTTDEEFVSEPSSCGLGACAATGARACIDGHEADTCVALPPAADDATCDAIDDDCDGSTDEDVAPTVTTCGSGACAAEGLVACVAGSMTDSCVAGTPAVDDLTCDAIDDDCDGATDDDYVSLPIACGVGACLAEGTTACAGGVEVDSCSPGGGTGADTVCNGLDDDCDGVADDDYLPLPTACGVGACAAQGSTACVGGAEIDSCQPGQPAVDDATCDGLDDDCDGATDDEYAALPTTCGVGACGREGQLACVAGQAVDSCEAGLPAPDDGTCDATDDDCDGSTDEDYQGRTVNCGVGACQASGTTTCDGGIETDSCQPLGGAGLDTICNGLDDDCDGGTDEDYVVGVTACGVGSCQAAGQKRCQGGQETDSCVPGQPAADDATCDGLDDDCDGSADEDYVAEGTTCGTGACARVGLLACAGGAKTDSCTPGQPAPTDATCNGVDDDCDGATDQGYAPRIVACGLGACQATGTTTCQGGVEIDSCTPESGSTYDVVCNGIDDDCNGQTDEGFVSTPTTCGVGPCAATGQKTCVNGVVVNSCTPGAPAASDASCNGVDDDCSGATDEDYVVVDTACGVGGCAAQGKRTCAAGLESDSCVPGTPGPEVCNGVDDDCNGKTDASDGAALLANDQPHCEKQAGVCQGTHKTAAFCVGGAWKPCNDSIYAYWVPTYQPVEGAACDGLDNDCDASVDEAYPVTATTCGAGACAATGSKTCVNGAETDSCTPGSPAAGDPTCDGVDDDCDGATDEDFGVQLEFCGVGACRATGTRTCVGGSAVVACAPGLPAADDATCDGVDDDCSGAADEDYVPTPTTCGVGACAAVGQKTCAGGVVTDSCVPAPIQPESCNNLDDNCNGVVDEGEGNPLCTTYYRDGDGDTYGDPAQHKCLCHPDGPGKYVRLNNKDCCDSDAAAHPAPPQPPYSVTARACSGFDFDCSGAEEKEPFAMGYCKCSDWTCISCSFAPGWEYGPPACGTGSNWISGCNNGIFNCGIIRSTKVQACR